MSSSLSMRFGPTDVEIARHFLKNIAVGKPMPRGGPEECQYIFEIDPTKLPDSTFTVWAEDHWYYYGKRNKTPPQNLWTPIGEEKHVIDAVKNGKFVGRENGELVGIKRSFAFTGNKDNDKEEFFMDEISLPVNVLETDWVFYHIYREEIYPPYTGEEEEE